MNQGQGPPRSSETETQETASYPYGRAAAAAGALLAPLAAVIAIADPLRDDGFLRVALLLLCLALTMAITGALVVVRRPARQRALRLLGACAYLICLLVVATSPETEPRRATGDRAAHVASGVPPKPQSVRVGRPIPVGMRPSAVTVADGVAWVAHAGGITKIDLASPSDPPELVNVPEVADIAVGPVSLVAVHGRGYATFFDRDTRVRTGSRRHFTERPGCALWAAGKAWVCDGSQSKVERMKRGTWLPHVAVPDSPTAILAAFGSVWVSLAHGWVIRIDPTTGDITAAIRTAEDTGALASGFGSIWVAHPRLRAISRIDPARNVVVGPAVRHVAGDIVALATAAGSLWAVSGSTDQLQRIDPEPGLVRETIKVAPAPSDLVASGRRLYMTSSQDNALIPIHIQALPRDAVCQVQAHHDCVLERDACIAVPFGTQLSEELQRHTSAISVPGV